jgi:hypothetical protein
MKAMTKPPRWHPSHGTQKRLTPARTACRPRHLPWPVMGEHTP